MIAICQMHLVDSVWPALRTGFVEACRKGGNQFSEAGLHLACRTGEAYLCLMTEGQDIVMAVVVQEMQWTDRQVLSVLAVTGGDRAGWWEPMIEWGREAFPGCKSIVFDGRPGWGRMPGVKVLQHVYEMDLGHGTV